MTRRLQDRISTVNYREEATYKRVGRAETKSGAKAAARLTSARNDSINMEK